MSDVQPMPFKATFKAATGYDAPWLTVEAATANQMKELIEDVNQIGLFAYMGNASKSFHAAYNVAKILGPVEVEAPTGEPINPAQQAFVASEKAAAAAPAPVAAAPDPWATPTPAEAAPAGWPPAAAAPAAPAVAGWGAAPTAAPVAAQAAPPAAAPAGWPTAPAPAAAAPAPTAPAATGWGAVATPAAPAGSAWGAAPGAPVTPPAAHGVPQVASFGPARVKNGTAQSGPNAGQPYVRYEDPRPWASIKDFIKTSNPNDPGLLAGTHRFEVYA